VILSCDVQYVVRRVFDAKLVTGSHRVVRRSLRLGTVLTVVGDEALPNQLCRFGVHGEAAEYEVHTDLFLASTAPKL